MTFIQSLYQGNAHGVTRNVGLLVVTQVMAMAFHFVSCPAQGRSLSSDIFSHVRDIHLKVARNQVKTLQQ
jgi:hypothetical protein